MGIAQELRKDARGDRRGDLTAVEIAAAWVVNHDKHSEDRILHGSKATERGDVAPLHIARGIEADLLRRAGLARDAIPLDPRLCTAARCNDLLEEADECAVHRALQRLTNWLR